MSASKRKQVALAALAVWIMLLLAAFFTSPAPVRAPLHVTILGRTNAPSGSTTCGQILEPIVKILARLQALPSHWQSAHLLMVHNHFPSIGNHFSSISNSSKRDARSAVGLNLSELIRGNFVNGHAIGDGSFAASSANIIAQ
jgi:hypothetical protein